MFLSSRVGWKLSEPVRKYTKGKRVWNPTREVRFLGSVAELGI